MWFGMAMGEWDLVVYDEKGGERREREREKKYVLL